MADKILVANWKMNLIEPHAYFKAFTGALEQSSLSGVKLGFAAPYTLLATVRACAPVAYAVYAQNVHERENGAFTGEISWPLLEPLAISGSLLGHSERRQFFHETHDQVAQKLALTLQRGHCGIVCIGETLAQREAGETFSVLTSQLTPLLRILTSTGACMLAYEPVWAIGTGLSATPTQAQEVHAWIQSFLETHGIRRNAIPLLYGGSANSANLEALLQQPDIDGVLVGGASLQPVEFAKMATIAGAFRK